MGLIKSKSIHMMAQEAKTYLISKLPLLIRTSNQSSHTRLANNFPNFNVQRFLKFLTGVAQGKVNVAIWYPYFEDFIHLTKEPMTISGVWGNSGNAKGNLEFIQYPDLSYEYTNRYTQSDTSRSIFVFCAQLNTDMLSYALRTNASGIIAPSIAIEIIGTAYKVDIPIIQMEGFGETSFSDATLNILTKLKGSEINLYANDYTPSMDRLPYITQNYSNQHDATSISFPIQNLKRIWHTFSTVLSSIGILN